MSFKVQSYYLNELQILYHFLEMERRFKRNTEHPFFPSLDYFLDDNQDKLSLLKKQVENMTFFIGLGNIPNRIKIEKLNDAAAYINLSETSFIDITIDEDIFNSNELDRIFGALAHELGHKLLKSSGLFFSGLLDVENEIYADLSTFYLGFGKFVLRGYNIEGNTRKSRSGYLTPETYIMAYVLTEYLNGREPDTTALPDTINEMISKISLQCKSKWIKNVSTEEDLKEQYKSLSTPIGTTATILEIINSFLENEYATVRSFIDSLSNNCLQQAKNTPLDCRKVAVLYSTFQNKSNINSFLAQPVLDKLLELVAIYVFERGVDLDKLCESIKYKCPNCHTPIINASFNTKEGKRIYHIRCKKCQTQFVIDNNLPQVKELIQKHVSFLCGLKPNFQENLTILSIIDSLISDLYRYKTIERNNRDYIKSLQKHIDNHRKKEEKWKSMNWWQRLWYKA